MQNLAVICKCPVRILDSLVLALAPHCISLSHIVHCRSPITLMEPLWRVDATDAVLRKKRKLLCTKTDLTVSHDEWAQEFACFQFCSD
jgi:hypothetical protein